MNLLNWIDANYKLERRDTFRGLSISIETDKGSVREGVDKKTGKPWKVKMTYPYGYIRNTMGVDGDHVDCFVGPNEQAKNVYVMHTKNPATGDYDEDKCMLGFDSAQAAKKALLENYNDPGFFQSMDTIPFEAFQKKALATKDAPKKIAANSALSIGTQVTVDGFHGRGIIIARSDKDRYTIRFRNGLYISRNRMFIHPFSENTVHAGGPGSGCQGENCGRHHTVDIKKTKPGDPNRPSYYNDDEKHWSVRVDGNHVGHVHQYSEPVVSHRLAVGSRNSYKLKLDPKRLEDLFPGVSQRSDINFIRGVVTGSPSGAPWSAVKYLRDIAQRMGSDHTFDEKKV